VIAVLGGLGAAVCWSAGTLAAARASRLIGANRVLAWVMLVGLVVNAPLALAAGFPGALHGTGLVWFAVAGAANVGGLLLAYDAMRLGKVSIVAPITSTEGAIAAVLAVIDGESLHASSAVLLGVVAVGVVLASRTAEHERAVHPARATLLAVAAALSFGIGLFSTGHLSGELPIVWAMLPPRLVGAAVVTLPGLARRRIGVGRSVLPYLVLSGLCEIGGFASYTAGSRHSIAISAVLASQFAALAAVAAFLFFRERLSRVQVAGVVVVVAGVAVLSALQA
jgi:drug/metabolite transporter (DMT)-like permease